MAEEQVQVIDAAAPVIYPAPAESTGGETQEKAAAVDAEKPKEGKSGFQRRIDRLTRDKRELQTQLAKMESRERTAERFGARPLDETSDAGEWGRDRNQQESAGITDLHTVQEKNQIEAELEKVQQELGKQPEPGKEGDSRPYHEQLMDLGVAEEHAQRHAQQVEEAAAWYPDFQDVYAAAPHVQVSAALQREIVALDNSADVVVALVRRPDIADALGKMAPNAAKNLLRELSANLSGEPAEPAKRAAPTPAPIRPVKKTAPTALGLDDSLPVEEWRARREAQIAKQKKPR